MGHAGSWDLHSYANGNPVAFCDPDGRLGKGMFYGERYNTASNIGAGIMQIFPEGQAIQNFANNLREVGTPAVAATRTVFGGPKENAILDVYRELQAREDAEFQQQHPTQAKIRDFINYGLSLPGVGPGGLGVMKTAAIAGKAGAGAKALSNPAPNQMVSLFRAVSPAEHKQLMATQTFQAGANSLGGKFFAESGKHATEWGTIMEGSGKFHVIEAHFPKNVADSFMRWERLDGIGPARYGELGPINAAKPTIVPWP